MSPPRSIFASALGFVLGACIPPPAASSVFVTSVAPSFVAEQQADDLRAKTIALISVKAELPYCAGVWVGDTSFVTAHHCFATDEDESSIDPLGRVYAYTVYEDAFERGTAEPRSLRYAYRLARVMAVDAVHDLALLQASTPLPAHRNARLAADSLRPGSLVSTMGHPLRLWWSFSTGQVSAIRLKPGPKKEAFLVVQTTTPIAQGSSGGGLFDSNNSLVGITHACVGMPDEPGHCTSMNLFIHAQYLESMLKGQAWL